MVEKIKKKKKIIHYSKFIKSNEIKDINSQNQKLYNNKCINTTIFLVNNNHYILLHIHH